MIESTLSTTLNSTTQSETSEMTIILWVNDRPTRKFLVPLRHFTIGCTEDCDICFRGGEVDDYCCEVVRGENGAVIRSLSQYAEFRGQRPFVDANLEAGDKVRFGSVTLEFESLGTAGPRDSEQEVCEIDALHEDFNLQRIAWEQRQTELEARLNKSTDCLKNVRERLTKLLGVDASEVFSIDDSLPLPKPIAPVPVSKLGTRVGKVVEVKITNNDQSKECERCDELSNELEFLRASFEADEHTEANANFDDVSEDQYFDDTVDLENVDTISEWAEPATEESPTAQSSVEESTAEQPEIENPWAQPKEDVESKAWKQADEISKVLDNATESSNSETNSEEDDQLESIMRSMQASLADPFTGSNENQSNQQDETSSEQKTSDEFSSPENDNETEPSISESLEAIRKSFETEQPTPEPQMDSAEETSFEQAAELLSEPQAEQTTETVSSNDDNDESVEEVISESSATSNNSALTDIFSKLTSVENQSPESESAEDFAEEIYEVEEDEPAVEPVDTSNDQPEEEFVYKGLETYMKMADEEEQGSSDHSVMEPVAMEPSVAETPSTESGLSESGLSGSGLSATSSPEIDEEEAPVGLSADYSKLMASFATEPEAEPTKNKAEETKSSASLKKAPSVLEEAFGQQARTRETELKPIDGPTKKSKVVKTDLSGIRELANETSNQALAASKKRKNSTGAMLSLFIGTVCLAAGIIQATMASAAFSKATFFAIPCFAGAFFCFGRYFAWELTGKPSKKKQPKAESGKPNTPEVEN